MVSTKDIFLCNHNSSIKIGKWILIPCYHLILTPYSSFANCPNNVLRAKGCSSESQAAFGCHVSQASFSLEAWETWQDLPWFLSPWHFEVHRPICCSTSLNLDVWCFLVIIFRLGNFRQKHHSSWVMCFSLHLTKWHRCLFMLLLVLLPLITWLS